MFIGANGIRGGGAASRSAWLLGARRLHARHRGARASRTTRANQEDQDPPSGLLSTASSATARSLRELCVGGTLSPPPRLHDTRLQFTNQRDTVVLASRLADRLWSVSGTWVIAHTQLLREARASGREALERKAKRAAGKIDVNGQHFVVGSPSSHGTRPSIPAPGDRGERPSAWVGRSVRHSVRHRYRTRTNAHAHARTQPAAPAHTHRNPRTPRQRGRWRTRHPATCRSGHLRGSRGAA